MAVSSKQVRISIKLDNGDFIQGMAKIEQVTDKTSKNMSADMKKSSQNMQTSFQKFKASAIASWALIAIAVARVTRAIVDSIKVAIEYQEVHSKFKTVFKGVEESAIKMRNELIEVYKLSRNEAEKALSTFQDILVPMGQTRDSAARLSGEFAKLAIDLGSFNNIPTADVMRDMQSAIVGNFETMKKYGVILSAVTIKELARKRGLIGLNGEVIQSSKAQLAYELILKSSTDAVGDFTRTEENAANQLKIFKSALEELKITIGNNLIPVVVSVTSGLTKLTNAVKDFLELTDAVPEESFIDFLKEADLQALEEQLKVITEEVKDFNAEITDLQPKLLGAQTRGEATSELRTSLDLLTAQRIETVKIIEFIQDRIRLLKAQNTELKTTEETLNNIRTNGEKFNDTIKKIKLLETLGAPLDLIKKKLEEQIEGWAVNVAEAEKVRDTTGEINEEQTLWLKANNAANELLIKINSQLDGSVERAENLVVANERWESILSNIQKAEEEIRIEKEKQIELYNNISTIANDMLGIMVKSIRLIGSQNDEFDAMLDTVEGIAEGVLNIATGVGTGDPLAAMQGAFGIISAILDAIEAKQRAIDDAINAQNEAIEEQQRLLLEGLNSELAVLRTREDIARIDNDRIGTWDALLRQAEKIKELQDESVKGSKEWWAWELARLKVDEKIIDISLDAQPDIIGNKNKEIELIKAEIVVRKAAGQNVDLLLTKQKKLLDEILALTKMGTVEWWRISGALGEIERELIKVDDITDDGIRNELTREESLKRQLLIDKEFLKIKILRGVETKSSEQAIIFRLKELIGLEDSRLGKLRLESELLEFQQSLEEDIIDNELTREESLKRRLAFQKEFLNQRTLLGVETEEAEQNLIDTMVKLINLEDDGLEKIRLQNELISFRQSLEEDITNEMRTQQSIIEDMLANFGLDIENIAQLRQIQASLAREGLSQFDIATTLGGLGATRQIINDGRVQVGTIINEFNEIDYNADRDIIKDASGLNIKR